MGIGEFIHQGLLPANPNQDDISWARNELMDPAANIRLLAGKMRRLKQALGLPNTSMLQASRSYLDAKAIATLAYLHNGKLDYPARILRYMQDAELHHQIRRLASHASIVMWDGCNECDYNQHPIYKTFVMKTVAEIDQSRAVW